MELCLAYVRAQPWVTEALVGAETGSDRPCNARREGGKSLVMLEGREGKLPCNIRLHHVPISFGLVKLKSPSTAAPPAFIRVSTDARWTLCGK